MRISTAFPQQYNTNTMLDLQTKLNNTQLKISSGQQYLTPGENPAAAAYTLSFNQAINETTQYQTNIDATNQRLSLEETTLASVTDTIQRLQELGLQGVSDSGNSLVARNAIADEFDQLNQQLLGLANTRNANGEYIFAGTQSTVMPFGAQNANSTVASQISVATSSTAETVPADNWMKFVTKEATTDALNYIVNVNPNGTLSDALAWATDQAATYTAMGQASTASHSNIVNTPASWQTAWDNTSPTFMTAFEAAFTDANKKGATPAAVAHLAVAPLASASVASSAAYDAYTKSLADYVEPPVTAASAVTTAAATNTTANTTTPTTTPTSSYVYSGANTQRYIQIGGTRTITDGDTGISVFGDAATGQTIFDAVKSFSAELRSDKPTLETLQKLDTALTQVSTVRSNVGARLNALDRQKQTNQDFIINTQTALSQVHDLDYASAITQLNSQQLSLQAAQQSYAKVQSMTLFKYI